MLVSAQKWNKNFSRMILLHNLKWLRLEEVIKAKLQHELKNQKQFRQERTSIKISKFIFCTEN